MRDDVPRGPGQPVVVVSTLDTKGRETAYVAARKVPGSQWSS